MLLFKYLIHINSFEKKIFFTQEYIKRKQHNTFIISIIHLITIQEHITTDL